MFIKFDRATYCLVLFLDRVVKRSRYKQCKRVLSRKVFPNENRPVTKTIEQSCFDRFARRSKTLSYAVVRYAGHRDRRTINDGFGNAQVTWNRCLSKDYATCARLALAHLMDRLQMANGSYALAPGVTVSAANAADDPDAKTDGRDHSETFDRLLVDRLGRYFGALTVNVKLLDDATARSVRELSEAAADASVQSGTSSSCPVANRVRFPILLRSSMCIKLFAFDRSQISTLNPFR